ncbi:MAG: hypothetical protein U0235_01445 [Polyangiaceae bacterium]
MARPTETDHAVFARVERAVAARARAQATLARLTKEDAPAAPPAGAPARDLAALAGALGGSIPVAYRAFLTAHDGWPTLTPVLDLWCARDVTSALARPATRDDLPADVFVVGLATGADHVVAIERATGAVIEIEEGERVRYADFAAFLADEAEDEDAGTERAYPGDVALEAMIATHDAETDRAIVAAYRGVPWWCSAAGPDLLRRWLWRAAEVEAIDADALLRMADRGGAVLAIAAGRRAPRATLERLENVETPLAWATRVAARPDDEALVAKVAASLGRLTAAPVLKPKAAEEAHVLALALLAAGSPAALTAVDALIAHANIIGERARALVADVARRRELR